MMDAGEKKKKKKKKRERKESERMLLVTLVLSNQRDDLSMLNHANYMTTEIQLKVY